MIIISYLLNSMDIKAYKNLNDSNINEMHDYYASKVNKSVDANNDNLFIWMQEHITIYFIADNHSGFAFATHIVNQSKDQSKFVEVPHEVAETLAYETSLYSRKKINLLIQNSVLEFDHNESIIESSLTDNFISGKSFIEEWVQTEYIRADKTLKIPAKDLVTLDTAIIHQSKMRFKELLSTVNDEQFKAEFEEFLFGYNNKRFFLAASAMGSIIEHLIFIILTNYNAQNLLGTRRPTANKYLQALEKQKYFKFTDRDSRFIDNIFQTRNSISHYNSGGVLKSQCDLMLNGLEAIYRRFYLPSKAYQANH